MTRSINPATCSKLMDPSSPVIYRSSYEKKFIYWLESSPAVARWGSECLVIPYQIPGDPNWHSYYPDFYVEWKNGEKWVVEIKPASQTVNPLLYENRKNSQWYRDQWRKNSSKWRAAQEFCKAKGFSFKILTEKTISKL